MKLTEVFKDLSIYKQVRNVKELDSTKTYLVEVEVGDKSKADIWAMMKQAKSVFDAKGITNVMYVPVVNGKADLNVKEMTQDQIKQLIKILHSYLG